MIVARASRQRLARDYGHTGGTPVPLGHTQSHPLSGKGR